MKIGEIVLSWVFSVVVGSLICGLFSTIWLSIIFAILSCLVSLPYLVLMILMTRKPRSFGFLQLIHVSLTLLTGLCIVLLENNFFGFSFILILYFVLGAMAQAYFHYRSPLRVERVDPEILDN
ncbi:MAG: hypothetical protein ACK45H_03705 [Bacteroidota bacterium]|jgi:hypothetical protein